MSGFDVSVVIPARHAADTIGPQLEALRDQETSRSWELVVVVNEGDDGHTYPVVERYLDTIPNLRPVRLTEIQGAGHARNVGAANARGRYLLFCDADDVVNPGWIEALAQALDEYDAVGGPLEERSLNTEETRVMRNPLVSDHLHLALGFPRAVSSNLGVRAEVFKELDGFDITYRLSQDTEFSIRLQVRGFRLGFAPDAVVRYRHGDDVRENLKKIYKWSRTRPRLYRDYREHIERGHWIHMVNSWGWLLLTSWKILGGKKRRLSWAALAVERWGRLIGSIKYRVLFI